MLKDTQSQLIILDAKREYNRFLVVCLLIILMPIHSVLTLVCSSSGYLQL